MEFYDSTVRTDLLRVALASEHFGGDDLTVHTDFTSRVETYNRLMRIFMDTYANYRNSIQTVATYLQEIQIVNPNFTLPLPRFNPIRVDPLEWFVLNSFDSNFVWDPVIFQYHSFRDETLDSLNAIALNINNVDLFVRSHLVSVYNQSRQTPTTLPFNSFAPAGSNNLFEVEIQVVRSRPRTRSNARILPCDITRTRSRSRPGSFSESD